MGAVTHWPWPADMRKVWLPGPPDRWGRPTSVRNDTLWHELHASRTAGEVKAARDWMVALRSDGWDVTPTYEHEIAEHAFTAVRDGFKVMGLARPGDEPDAPRGSLPMGSISMWDDRRISVSPLPIVYPGWEAIRVLSRRCPVCGSDDVPTVRVAFANRACHACAPGMREKMETPGWAD